MARAAAAPGGRIYLVRTPLRQVAGMTYGGPMRIRIGRRRAAYAGFATRELADMACRHWSIPAEHFVEPWDEAVRHEAPATRTGQVLLFRNAADFRGWLEDPQGFDLESHLLHLHPGSVDQARRRSA